MNYLVTGGAGFIGSNIVAELLKRGHKVRVLDNFSTGRRSNLAPFIVDRSSSIVHGSQSEVPPDQRRTKNEERRTTNFELVEGDVRSPFTVMEAMSAPFGVGQVEVKAKVKSREPDPDSTSTSTSTSSCAIDFVLHQAALPSVPRSIKDPLTTNEVNVVGTLNVLKAALACGVKRVVYASSSSVYGNSEELPKHERMIPNPMSPYAAAKLAGEHYCRVFSNLYDLETVVLRYFNVFGPNQDPTSQYAAVIPKFIAAIREGRRPVIFGDGEQSRDFTPVANVVAANLAACTVPLGAQAKVKVKVKNGETGPASTSTSSRPQSTMNEERRTMNEEPFLLSNVAVGSRYTLNFLVQEICRILGKRVEPEYAPPRPGDVKHSLASVEVMTRILGLTSPTSFQVGLERLIRNQGL